MASFFRYGMYSSTAGTGSSPASSGSQILAASLHPSGIGIQACLIRLALRFRGIVVALCVLLVIYGIYGLGDATLNGRELAVASYLSDHVAPLLIGRDARRIEDLWQYLYKGAYWRRGPVTMSAIAAVDTGTSFQ